MQAFILFKFNITLVILNLIQYFNCAMSRPLETEELEVSKLQTTIEDNNNMTTKIGDYMYNITSGTTLREDNEKTAKLRPKRQSGAGKFVDAATMPQTKLLVLWLQMFANMWRNVYVGGKHPLDKRVPKPVVIMLKRRIGEVIFPKLKVDETNK